jgi:hypothetical protein
MSSALVRNHTVQTAQWFCGSVPHLTWCTVVCGIPLGENGAWVGGPSCIKNTLLESTDHILDSKSKAQSHLAQLVVIFFILQVGHLDLSHIIRTKMR